MIWLLSLWITIGDDNVVDDSDDDVVDYNGDKVVDDDGDDVLLKVAES